MTDACANLLFLPSFIAPLPRPSVWKLFDCVFLLNVRGSKETEWRFCVLTDDVQLLCNDFSDQRCVLCVSVLSLIPLPTILRFKSNAVINEGFKLGCIYCKMRGEVDATATVKWSFKGSGDSDFSDGDEIIDPRFYERLVWNGSKHTRDLQDGSIYILNVTYNDTGTYKCEFSRLLKYSNYDYQTAIEKNITINVVARLTRGMASILSEVMMYVSIIGLQFWLLVEMIYCYRKISAAGEEALRESAEEYLAIASESKDNCAGAQVAE
uniref:Sodium channel regulatory subunit beta-3 n=1 Tax=Oreochromis aureus TaxID=47969 RepID=A0AAZ1Y2F8_OREAU